MITGRVEGDDRVVAKLGSAGIVAKDEIRQSIGVLTLRLAVRVKLKLSDDVLHVRTGRLRRSITSKVTDDAQGVVGTVGTNVEYARPHEYGFKGTQSVKQSLRTITQAWGRPIAPMQVIVRPHTRKVDYPAKSFLRSALAGMSDEIAEELAQAVKRALK